MARPDLNLDDLGQFARTAWGRPGPQALLRHLPPRLFLGLYAGMLRHVPVRDGYCTALQALHTDTVRYERGAYVTGQPNIGKS